MSDAWHVYPVNDLIQHDTQGDDCACGPRSEPVKRDDGSMSWIVTHRTVARIAAARPGHTSPTPPPTNAPPTRRPPHGPPHSSDSST